MKDIIDNAGRAKRRGALPYGYKLKELKHVIDAPKAKVIRKIFRAYLAGNSCSSIADDLTGRGIPAPRGGRWSPSSVLSIIRNDFYAGQNASLAEESSGRKKIARLEAPPKDDHFPAIIDKILWDEAQCQRATHSKFAARNSKRLYLLKGLIQCGICGSLFTSQTVTVKGREYRYYRCGSKTSSTLCKAIKVRASDLEESVWAEVASFLSRPMPILKRVMAEIRKEGRERADLERKSARLSRKIGEAESMCHRLEMAVARGEIAEEEAIAKLENLRVAVNDLRSTQGTVKERARVLRLQSYQTQNLKEVLARLRERVDNADPELKAETMRRLIKRIIITTHTDKRGVKRPHAEIHYEFTPLSDERKHRGKLPID